MAKPATFAEVVELAPSFIAVGNTRVYLSKYDGFKEEPPYEEADDVKNGCSHRMDIATSLDFTCFSNGLEIHWSLDLEKPGSNGSSEYKIDREALLSIMPRLKPTVRQKLKAILREDAVAVRKRGQEYADAAARQFADAAILEHLGK